MREIKEKKESLRIVHPFLGKYCVEVWNTGFQIKEKATNGRDWVSVGTPLQSLQHVTHYLRQFIVSDMSGEISPQQYFKLNSDVDKELNSLFSGIPDLPSVDEIKAEGEKIEEPQGAQGPLGDEEPTKEEITDNTVNTNI